MSIKATNQNVFILRDEAEKEKDGLLLPSIAVVKPHVGKIFSVGKKVNDPDIKHGIGKKAIFHQGTGQEIQYDVDTFIVLHADHILGVD